MCVLNLKRYTLFDFLHARSELVKWTISTSHSVSKKLLFKAVDFAGEVSFSCIQVDLLGCQQSRFYKSIHCATWVSSSVLCLQFLPWVLKRLQWFHCQKNSRYSKQLRKVSHLNHTRLPNNSGAGSIQTTNLKQSWHPI